MKAIKILLAICLLQLFVFSSSAFAQGGDPLDHDSNKNTIRAELANGGWHVVYGKTFEEGDWVAVAACTYYGCLAEYFDYYLDESIEKFQRQAPDLTVAVIKDVVLKAMKTQGTVFTQGKLQVTAGIATYQRWKVIGMHVPGLCNGIPCMKYVEQQSPMPNHHQPYVRFRLTGGTPPPSGYDSIHFTNKCSKQIQTAIHYKNLNDEWVTEGWWVLDPGETNFVAKTKNRIFYTYAHSTDADSPRLYWSGEDTHSSIRGSSATYGFKKQNITTTAWGTWKQSFSCS